MNNPKLTTTRTKFRAKIKYGGWATKVVGYWWAEDKESLLRYMEYMRYNIIEAPIKVQTKNFVMNRPKFVSKAQEKAFKQILKNSGLNLVDVIAYRHSTPIKQWEIRVFHDNLRMTSVLFEMGFQSSIFGLREKELQMRVSPSQLGKAYDYFDLKKVA